jgi:hypothetical protein
MAYFALLGRFVEWAKGTDFDKGSTLDPSLRR